MPLTEKGRGTGVALAVDLINTWDELEDPPDLIEGPADVRVWLEWHGFRRVARGIRAADVERVRRLRERLEGVFDAEDEAHAVALLNELASEHGTPPQLERSDGRWRLRSWPDERAGLSAIAAYAAVGLLEAIRDLGWSRFGRCAGAPCRCAYVDRSRNRSRRYCCQLCADRVAQAEHRRRQKEARPAS
jgi:predicted RNA-binding Zn ribbon-like protein